MRARLLLTTVLVLANAHAAIARAQGAATTPRNVVFVCEHGTAKSVVALEYFRKLARAKGLDVEAVSRGTNPDTAMSALVRAGLEGDGFDVSAFRPARFSLADLSSALMVVSFDAKVEPVVAGTRPIARWDGTPSIMANYATSRDVIRARVERLVDSLVAVKTRQARP